jgi:hypothetical protein
VPLLLVVVVAAIVALNVRGYRRSRQHLDGWAGENGMQVSSARLRLSPFGPFAWTHSRSQRLYNFTAVDSEGRHREGVARVGGWFTGALSDRVDVQWRDE